jgi:hypothetical protein
LYQARDLGIFCCGFRHAKDGGGVNGSGHWTVIGWKYLSAVFCQSKLCTEQTLRRSCTQTDNELRTNGRNLRFQPWAACGDFKGVWLLMQPNLAARFPFEMLHSVGDVHIGSIDACRLEAFIKQLTGWPDERLPLLVFAIAGLFPHQENSGMGSAFPKDYLRSFPIKVASAASLGGFPQSVEVMVGGEKFQGRMRGWVKQIHCPPMMQFCSSWRGNL